MCVHLQRVRNAITQVTAYHHCHCLSPCTSHSPDAPPILFVHPPSDVSVAGCNAGRPSKARQRAMSGKENIELMVLVGSSCIPALVLRQGKGGREKRNEALVRGAQKRHRKIKSGVHHFASVEGKSDLISCKPSKDGREGESRAALACFACTTRFHSLFPPFESDGEST